MKDDRKVYNNIYRWNKYNDKRCNNKNDVNDNDENDGDYDGEGVIDFVYISEREELCSNTPGGLDNDWHTPAIETTDNINSPIINIILAYIEYVGSREYSSVSLLIINNTTLC